MLKVWNMSLVILTYGLSIFGTFLTRSGVISSVHAFAESSLGVYFLIYLAIALTIAVALLVWRLPQLRSDHRLESVLSRESSFLFNNLFLVGIMFSVLWGTMFPIISEAVRGVKISVAGAVLQSGQRAVGPCPAAAVGRVSADCVAQGQRAQLSAQLSQPTGRFTPGCRCLVRQWHSARRCP